MQITELWHLINPEMEDYVSKQQVMEFIKTLAEFAVIINQSKWNQVHLIISIEMLLKEETDVEAITPAT